MLCFASKSCPIWSYASASFDSLLKFLLNHALLISFSISELPENVFVIFLSFGAVSHWSAWAMWESTCVIDTRSLCKLHPWCIGGSGRQDSERISHEHLSLLHLCSFRLTSTVSLPILQFDESNLFGVSCKGVPATSPSTYGDRTLCEILYALLHILVSPVNGTALLFGFGLSKHIFG